MLNSIPWRPSSGLGGYLRRSWTLVVLGLVVGLAGSAWAQGASEGRETVAVLRLPIQGVTPELEAELRAALREALVRGGLDVLPDADVEGKLRRDPQLSACTTRSCFARVALTLGVLRVVEGEAESPQRSAYRIRLQLRDLRTGQIVAGPEEERCDICGAEEARQMVARVAVRLARSAPPPPRGAGLPETGTLQLDSQPLGAAVLIDGVLQQDRTPAMFLLPLGVHTLELRAPGHRSVRRRVEIVPGRHTALNLELVPVPPRRPWLTALSAVLAAGAVGLGIGSGVLWSFHGRPAYGEPPEDPCQMPQLRCPFKYDNRASGAATAALAGLVAAGAAVAISFDYAPPRRRVLVVPPEPAQRETTRGR
ncbi:MAG: PEGA domain-containing protein [Myxococcales bacterium]|nr:PEGA domain-containing protein [Myxococcota bacterium]MDW8282754.1 PEGA domain-containing protein [Myxococcales bacterium]